MAPTEKLMHMTPIAILPVERRAIRAPAVPNWQKWMTPAQPGELGPREQAKKDVEKAVQQKMEEARQAGLWNYDTTFQFPTWAPCLDWDC